VRSKISEKQQQVRNFAEVRNFARQGAKSALGIIQLWFNYFTASFCQGTWQRNCVNYLKNPKSVAGHTKGPRGPRVWDLFYDVFLPLTLEYYRRSARPGSNEIIHVKLRKRKSARFELFSSFMFLCDE